MNEDRLCPNPRLVALMSYALDQVTSRLDRKTDYSEWLLWASAWKDGERSPARCVEVARHLFEEKENAVGHALGQLAWGAKEACYETPISAWLVIRYIADAMIAFGIAFPKKEADAALALPNVETLLQEEKGELLIGVKTF